MLRDSNCSIVPWWLGFNSIEELSKQMKLAAVEWKHHSDYTNCDIEEANKFMALEVLFPDLDTKPRKLKLHFEFGDYLD